MIKIYYLVLILFAVKVYGSFCPENCACVPVEPMKKLKVDCTRIKLQTIPPANTWPLNTYSMDLSMNKIRKIDEMESSFDLKYLDLATNEIESIKPKAFEHLTQLVALDLSHNILEKVPEQLLDGLNNIQSLNLSYNKLKYLPENLFAGKKSLEEVRLAHNPLQIIEPALFQDSPNLKVLDISSIEAFSFKEGLFHKLEQLEELDISGNDFTTVPTNSLRSSHRLRVLQISSNPIRNLDEDSFRKLNTLEELYIDNMKDLTQIKDKTFSHLYWLRKLSITDNPHLSYIDKHAFIGMHNRSWLNLKDLSLRSNRLTELSEHALPWRMFKLLITNLMILDCRLK